jgi:hypothetical protein
MVDDPRVRTKVFCDTYLTAANILKDDGVTQLQTHVMYEQPEVPTLLLLDDRGNDALFIMETPVSKPLWTHNHQTYAYVESVPISIWTKDRSGVTGATARWTCEAELRRIVETYFGGAIGALRRFERLSGNEQDMGAWRFYSVKYSLVYKRAADNFVPSYPALGFGTGWQYDGDRLSGGVEGTWTGTNCTPTTDRDYLTVTKTTSDASIVHGTNLTLSTSVYPYLRYRYKCSNASVVPEILVTFTSGTQTITLPNSTIFTTGTATLTAAKTVNTVTLKSKTVAGSVIWDFTEIYSGDYVFPNCTKISPPETLNDAIIKIPYMIGNRIQALGADSIRLSMTCDLDVENPNLTWKRPQTSGSKTDQINVQVFNDISFSEAQGTMWHWLNWGKGACKTRLSRMAPNYFEDNTLELEFTEYRLSNAATRETANSRFSLDQVS